MPLLARPARGLAGALVGVLTAVPGVLLHQAWWGLALTVAASATTSVALPAGWSRVGYAAGWAGALSLLVGMRPEGDYLVPARAEGYVLMGVALGLVVVSLVTVPPPSAPERVEQEADGA